MSRTTPPAPSPPPGPSPDGWDRIVAALGTEDRLAALAELGLDRAEADAAFDRLARLATRLIGTPIALVSFVGESRQVFPGSAGLEGPYERSSPLTHSFCRHVVATREPLVIRDARQDPRVAGNPAIADLGVIAYAGWPLVSPGGEALGSLCAIDTAPREWTDDDLDVLRDLADIALAAVEVRAAVRVAVRALEREHEVSRTLQASLLPEELPTCPGVVLGARYVPAENLIGGDWYDVFRLPGGRIGFAMGDVVGHGIESAATAGRLRTALRGFALEDEAPGHVLGCLADLAHARPAAAWTSVIYGILDVRRRALHWTRAGHPPPVLRTGAGVELLPGPDGPLLTILPRGCRYPEAVTPLERGATLLLYSDGLVERRGADTDVRVAELRRVLADAPEDPDALCGYVLDAMGAAPGEDDVALLALRVD
jgi:serine phosphatase RsbU (regulator of sigma subunit)